MPEPGSAQVARFLFHRDHYAPSKAIARPRAFLPGPDGKTSVAEITNMSAEAVMALSVVVGRLRRRDAKAHAELDVSAVESAGLTFVRDDNPFERHGNLTGWPQDPGPIDKARRKHVAQTLSSASVLVLYDDEVAGT